MAGHNKWSKVKRIKGAIDAKRGKLFSRLSKEIMVAARTGGGNPDFNPRLRSAVQAARDQSMPNDNIERAIRKGTGEAGADAVEELVYEGYGPGGVAIVVEAATDNKNRTAADLRSIFGKNQGNLGGPGSVLYLFHRKGRMQVPMAEPDEDRILEVVLEAGAEELLREEDGFVVLTPPDALYTVEEALKNAGLPVEDPKLTFVAENHVPVADNETAAQVLRLCDALEDCDDVLNVHANFEISDEVMTALREE